MNSWTSITIIMIVVIQLDKTVIDRFVCKSFSHFSVLWKLWTTGSSPHFLCIQNLMWVRAKRTEFKKQKTENSRTYFGIDYACSAPETCLISAHYLRQTISQNMMHTTICVPCFLCFSFYLHRRNSPTNRNFGPFGQGHSLLHPMVDSNRVSQAAVLIRMWTFSCIQNPKRLFLSHSLLLDARKGATQYFSKKEEISFPLESEVDIACSDVCSINSTFWLSVEFFPFGAIVQNLKNATSSRQDKVPAGLRFVLRVFIVQGEGGRISSRYSNKR